MSAVGGRLGKGDVGHDLCAHRRPLVAAAGRTDQGRETQDLTCVLTAPSGGCFGKNRLWVVRAGAGGPEWSRLHWSKWKLVGLDQMKVEEGSSIWEVGVQREPG